MHGGAVFAIQLQALCDLAVRDPAINAPAVADTLSHDRMEAMAVAALTATRGAVVAIGLLMGGYVALEMASLAPPCSGTGLGTSYKSDTAEKTRLTHGDDQNG